MANTTFAGPLRVGNADTVVGTAQVARVQPITVTATANTDIQVPMSKCKLLTAINFTSTGFGAATDATLQIGSTLGGVDYVAPVTIKAVGKTALTFAAGLAAFPTIADGATLYIRIVQTGAASATGRADLVLEYMPLP